ncbi:MAG TPA: glycosyltransferase 87 family protein [Terriglobales bacterium]|jgi:hypothetical protein
MAAGRTPAPTFAAPPRRAKIFVFLAIVFGAELSAWLALAGIPLGLQGRADFRNLYSAASMVRSGNADRIYDLESQARSQNSLVSPRPTPMPYLRLAYEALGFVPLSFLPYKQAYIAFLILNLLLLALLPFWIRTELAWLQGIPGVLRPLLFLLFPPLAFSILQGQDSVLFLVLLVFAFLLLRRGQEGRAGLLLGVGVCKLPLLAPLVLLFALWRRWRFVMGLSLTAALCIGLSAWLVGATEFAAYVRMLAQIKSVATVPELEQYPYPALVAAMPSLRGLLFVLLHARISASALALAYGVPAALALAAVACWNREARASSSLLLVAITASCLLSYYIFLHDLSVLALPVGVAAGGLRESVPAGRWTRGIAGGVILAAGLAVVAPSFLFLLPIPIAAFLGSLSRAVGEKQEAPDFPN